MPVEKAGVFKAALVSLQVHEKSILLPLLPITLLCPQLPGPALWLPAIACFSMWPLLSRDGLTAAYPACLLLWGAVALLALDSDAWQHNARDRQQNQAAEARQPVRAVSEVAAAGSSSAGARASQSHDLRPRTRASIRITPSRKEMGDQAGEGAQASVPQGQAELAGSSTLEALPANICAQTWQSFSKWWHGVGVPLGGRVSRLLVAVSAVAALALHLVRACIQPPTHLPFLFDALIIQVSFVNFALAALYLNICQWTC